MKYCDIIDSSARDLVPTRPLHCVSPEITPQKPTPVKMQHSQSYIYQPSQMPARVPFPRTESVPNRPHVVYYPSPRAPTTILPPLLFISKPNRPRLTFAEALERGPRLLSNILAAEDQDMPIFRCGLQTIKLKINWPGYDNHTRHITLPRPRPSGNYGCVALLVAIAEAYDEFIQSKKARGAVSRDSYWSISSHPDRYVPRNLIPEALKHCGSDVFQVDVTLHVRSTMQ